MSKRNRSTPTAYAISRFGRDGTDSIPSASPTAPSIKTTTTGRLTRRSAAAIAAVQAHDDEHDEGVDAADDAASSKRAVSPIDATSTPSRKRVTKSDDIAKTSPAASRYSSGRCAFPHRLLKNSHIYRSTVADGQDDESSAPSEKEDFILVTPYVTVSARTSYLTSLQ